MSYIIARKAVFGGDCIGKIDGKTVFIRQNPHQRQNSLFPTGALPGEKLKIKIIQSKKDYDIAVITDIVQASEHRIQPFCPVYGICGGCNFQYADYAYQLALKKSIVEDLLRRALPKGKYSVSEIITVNAPDMEYRSRFQFHDGGLRQRNSHDIIPIRDCPCAVNILRGFLRTKGLPTKGAGDSERMTVFADERLVPDNSRTAGAKIACEADPSPLCLIELHGKTVSFDVRAFFQSNIYMLEKTLPLIAADLQGTHLLDMYGGTGVLSLFAAQHFETVTIVEADTLSVSRAEQNFKNNGMKCAVIIEALKAGSWARRYLKNADNAMHFDALIIDPPRAGIEPETMTCLCTLKPPVVRSLSCNPATHARDLNRFIQAGYILEKLYLLDFYPHTSHIETLACLRYAD